MRSLVFSVALVGMSSSACRSVEARLPNALTSEEREDGWVLLFDGSSSQGWRGFRQALVPEGWRVEDGMLACVGSGGDLVTEGEYESFVLELEWKIAPGGNSGIFFHVDEEHDTVWQTGPEMQILDDELHPDGQDPRTSAGANYALHPAPRGVVRPAGEWNHARLVVDGDRVRHELNGELVCEYRLWSDAWRALVAASKFAGMPDYGMRKTGSIALQDHGDPVWFRNIRLLPLTPRD